MNSPLHSFCLNGKNEEVKQLLRNNPQIDINKVDEDGQTPLYIACKTGWTEIVKLLLNEKRVDVNKGDETPLYIACSRGRLEVVKVLLNDKRIDVNKAPIRLVTPISIACEKGYSEIVEILLNDKRVDVNKPDSSGWTPFFVACLNEHIEVLELLLNDMRVDVDFANQRGITPFFIACWNKKNEAVKHILASEREIKVNIMDHKGKTPIDITREEEKKGKKTWESEEEFQARKSKARMMTELLESFERNPSETRFKLEIELGLTSNKLFIMIFFFSFFSFLFLFSIHFFSNIFLLYLFLFIQEQDQLFFLHLWFSSQINTLILKLFNSSKRKSFNFSGNDQSFKIPWIHAITKCNVETRIDMDEPELLSNDDP